MYRRSWSGNRGRFRKWSARGYTAMSERSSGADQTATTISAQLWNAPKTWGRAEPSQARTDSTVWSHSSICMRRNCAWSSPPQSHTCAITTKQQVILARNQTLDATSAQKIRAAFLRAICANVAKSEIATKISITQYLVRHTFLHFLPRPHAREDTLRSC